MAGVLGLAAPVLMRTSGGDPPPKVGGPGKPLSPQEALKEFRLDPGLRIELVAAEPTIQSPVAMAFDAFGRIWVVEMADYPNGPAPGQKPQGRIRILEDMDGDGYFEHATTFADGLLFANGVLPWKDGAIITQAPAIVHLRDTDGDGKADRTDVWYEGFAAQNPQLRVSHPNLGLDGWVYVANGLRGGKVRPAVDPGAKPIDLGGMDFRFDPVHGGGEAISGMGQYGNTFDPWGRRFVCDNRHHLRHVVFDSRYLHRNPLLAAPNLVEDVSVLEEGPVYSGGKVYPLSRNWTTSSLHEGRFTAACGVFIYGGALLGPKYHGAAFTCEPTGNLVHMEVLTPKGATFQAKPARDGVEFLATPDDWFRPVFLTSGPDGALYVVDMYRAVIEHPEFMPPELQKRPDLALGKDKGRIWRILPEKHAAKPPRPDLAKASLAELVALLEHVEPWWRTTAQRLILERQDKAVVEPLRKLFDETKKPLAKLHAAYLLNGFDELDFPRLLLLLADPHPRLREHGVWMAEPHWKGTAALRKRLLALADDDDARVRFQVALTLGDSQSSEVLDALARIAERGCQDHWIRLAVESAAPQAAAPVLQRLLRRESPLDPVAGQALIRELAAIVGARKDAAAFLGILRTLAELYPAAGARLEPDQLAGLVGLAEGLERRGKTLTSVAQDFSMPTKEAGAYQAEISKFIQLGRPVALDDSSPVAQRLLAIRLFAHASWNQAKVTLVPLMADSPEQEIRLAALRAIAAHTDKEVPAVLMKSWPGATPAVRREIVEAMLRRPDRILVLLDEVEAKRVKISEIDANRTRQLVKHADATVRERAKKLLQDNLPADRQAVYKEYQAALTLKGDAKAGREVFRKNCATCHRVASIGTDVGPDIADSRTKTVEALLTDILLPNQAIDNNYLNYLVTTKDGRVLSGILAAETATSLTLKRAEGQTDVVLRKDVEEIASTGISLMPEGLEKAISVREMADLLRFLKDWRYLDGSVPVAP
jgi:putative membrane-bound dehydrogenase-like protein